MATVSHADVEDLLRRIARAERNEFEQYWSHEPVIGWRVWTLGGNPKTVLQGMNGTLWRKSYMVATHKGSNRHPSPYWRCGCGVNAMKSRDGLDTYSVVIGRVALTGMVHEYTRGYRAERGEILDLQINNSALPQPSPLLRDILADHYRVPVEIVDKKGNRLDERW